MLFVKRMSPCHGLLLSVGEGYFFIRFPFVNDFGYRCIMFSLHLFGAVLCHVDCAHGRAADEHDEEEEGDESGLFVLDDELLELIHIYILSAFRQRQSQG